MKRDLKGASNVEYVDPVSGNAGPGHGGKERIARLVNDVGMPRGLDKGKAQVSRQFGQWCGGCRHG